MLSGYKLKMLRIKKRVTQTKIAKDLGVTRNYISMIENEHRDLNEEQYKKYLDSLYRHANATNESEEDPAEGKAIEEVQEIEDIEKVQDVKQKKKSKKVK